MYKYIYIYIYIYIYLYIYNTEFRTPSLHHKMTCITAFT